MAFKGKLWSVRVVEDEGAMLACRHERSKRMGVVALIGALILSVPAMAQQTATCPPARTPIKLNFKTEAPDPIHNHRLTIAGIANLLRSQGMPAPAGQRALGITLTKTMFGLQAASQIMTRGNGYCVYLTSVDVDFGWNRVEVYVPTDFPKGSCQYNVVLDHENQHVAINRALLREFAPRLRARLEAILAGTKPLYTRSPNGATDVALADLNKQLSGMLKEFESLQKSRNAGIDSPANYTALSGMCKDWDADGGAAR